MAFDIRASFFSEDGEYDEEAANAFAEEVLDRFAKSPEFQALPGRSGYAGLLLDYAASYEGEALSEISRRGLEAVLFEVIPRKVCMRPDEAPDMIAELRAFFTWLDREFALPNARVCLGVLTDRAVEILRAALSDDRNFGMAKSFFMMGRQLGYDMSTERGLAEFTQLYNSSLAMPPAGAAPRSPRLSIDFDSSSREPFGSLPPAKLSRDERRKKRKQERANKKRNRR